MGPFNRFNQTLGKKLIKGFDNVDDHHVRIRYGQLAGWLSIFVILSLFMIEIVLGLMTESISLVAYAFHLLSHLANSVILVVSYWIMARPATEKTPFGHGRMEHIAPLVMSIFLFISGIQIGESAIHQVIDPHAIHYWSTLPWIILASILVKEWLGRFVQFLGKRVKSHTIQANAFHHRIDIILNITVLIGLVLGHHYHRPELDGLIGIFVSIWLLYLGYDHAQDAIIPLLGKAPSLELIQEIRETANSVRGVEDVHEIIVHDYGSKYFITLHIEVSNKNDAATMHGIMEHCETRLKKKYGGEVIGHTDPRLEPTPEILAIEDKFRKIVDQFPRIVSYHSFRVVSESHSKFIIVADIKPAQNVIISEIDKLVEELDAEIRANIPQIAYCSFNVDPIFAY